MAKFTVRVELHSPIGTNDYNILYQEMEKQGFSKTIMTEEGEFNLPDGEYLIDETDFADVVKLANKAIKQIPKEDGTYGILITQGERKVYRLKKV